MTLTVVPARVKKSQTDLEKLKESKGSMDRRQNSISGARKHSRKSNRHNPHHSFMQISGNRKHESGMDMEQLIRGPSKYVRHDDEGIN